MTPLYAFLNRYEQVPFVWGGHDGGTDCCLFLADWCAWREWPDPAAEVRFTYHDRSSCQRETRFLTDPVTIMSICAEDVAGMEPTDDIKEGDVAVIRLGPNRYLGAIWTGSMGWASKAEEGIIFHDAGREVLKAWSVGYEA